VCSQGVFVLEAALAVSISIVLLLPNRLLAQLPVPPEDSTVAQLTPLLERIQQEQKTLSDALARLAKSQETISARQALDLRRHYAALAGTLHAERDAQQASLDDMGQLILTISLTVAGVLLTGMAVIGWSVLRALQRLPRHRLMQPSGYPEPAWAVLNHAAPTELLDDLEKRLLRMAEAADRITHPERPHTSSESPAPTSLPGDFL